MSNSQLWAATVIIVVTILGSMAFDYRDESRLYLYQAERAQRDLQLLAQDLSESITSATATLQETQDMIASIPPPAPVRITSGPAVMEWPPKETR